MKHFTAFEEMLKSWSEDKSSLLNAIKQHFLIFSSEDPINNELKVKQQKHLFKCPHCGATNSVVGHGFVNKRRRFKCSLCNKTFMETRNTSIYWLHKTDKVLTFIQCLLEAKSIRKSAAITGISVSTAFAWRHKFLSSLPEIMKVSLSDLVELSAFQMDYSEKGTPIPIEKEENLDIPTTIIAASDKDENMIMKVIGRGDNITKDFSAFVTKHIDKKATICTEKGKIAKILKKMEYKIYQIDSKRDRLVRNVAKHTHLIQKTIFNFVEWMSKFQQVATKYLQNYLNWFLFLQRINKMANPEKIFLEKTIISDQAWLRWLYLKKHLLLVE